jgi:CRISPR-associated protein Csd1
MGLIKAYFVRLKPGGDTTMTAYLNHEHPESAYHCGRLLAVLAELQYAALGDVGAGVVQRYYAAASQAPGLILGRLVRNAQFHLNKPDKPWLGSKYEKPMMEIAAKLKDEFPRTLDLKGQGLFALGYYQQLAELRLGNKPNTTAYVINEQGVKA